ncbi:MAG: HRDC domain-containing protein [Blastocatellia bacterium]
MAPDVMASSISYQYVIDPDDARAALAAFAGQPVIGLDTETYWDFGARQNRLSLLQLAAPAGEVIVIDALTAGLEEARALIENPSAMMAAHNARFDEGVLREAGFEVAGLVDTLRLARRTLRLRSFSLASVSEHLFGVALDKTYQQSDWRRRPLSRAQLDYAALDAQIALRVYQDLSAQLEEAGRLEEELSRAKISLPEDGTVVFNRARARSKRQPVELRPLTTEERQVVERLKRWRKQTAEHERIPAYLICHDRTLEHLAVVRPGTVEELADIFGLGAARIAKYGPELLTQVQGSGD